MAAAQSAPAAASRGSTWIGLNWRLTQASERKRRKRKKREKWGSTERVSGSWRRKGKILIEEQWRERKGLRFRERFEI
ncbi:hypothetical protein TIFTF001_030254 [Ficus carica]|uniref:Uncharacterized protein n=1 Tax=Ficus carica TaxID=3494 RepID=A0AA88DT15_FICCA|nr:hypothetical protein TIFTF001_030254 [Ficus carica]